MSRPTKDNIVRYMTKGWLHAKDMSRTYPNDAHVAKLRCCVRPTQVAFVRVMKQTHGNPCGIEFRHARTQDRWAFVLADASEPGMRIQFFDAHGFYSHQHYATLEEAVEEMLSQGFTQQDSRALDRMASTTTWLQGMAWLEKMHERVCTGTLGT